MECDTSEERNGELEDIVLITIQNEAQKITDKNMRQVSVEYKTMFSDLIAECLHLLEWEDHGAKKIPEAIS